MTLRRFVLPITVYAALLSSAPAATVTLTDAWQNLGTGPFILQTQGGDGMFEASAAAPTDNGLAVGKNQVPFAYPSTLSIWGKRRAQARNNAGAPVDTTVVVTPMTLAGGGSGAAYTGPAAAQAGSSSTTAMPVQRTDGKAPLTAGETIVANQGGAPWAVSWTGQTVGITGTVQLGAGSAAIGSVSVSNFPTTQQVSGTVAATQSGAYTVTQGPAGTAKWLVDGSGVTQPVSGTVAATEADGANVTLGAKADAAAGTGNGSVIAQLKQLHLDSIGPSFGTYNSTAPTLASGAVGSLQLDVNGQLKAVVNPAAGSTWSVVDGNLVQTINTAGASATKAVTVQGNAGGIPVPSAEAGSAVAAVGIAPVVTQSGTTVVGKGSQGNLYSAYAVNTTTTAGYLVCVNAATAPASGAAITPVDVAALPGSVGAAAQINYGAGPPNAYSTGITCLVTTSLTTNTAGGNAFIQARVR